MLGQESPTTEYPLVYVEKIDDWPKNVEGEELEFRLIYKGRLPAVSRSDARVVDKHRIRRELHKQLGYLWESNSILKGILTHPYVPDMIGTKYGRCGFRFFPLVGSAAGLACALDILFLRRDQPGNLVTHRGDLDNRIKVLFDALQVPETCDQLPKDAKPEDGEDPFFCLLFNDRQITEVKVTTDQLLTPLVDGESVNDVELIIGVRTIRPADDEHMLVFPLT